MSTSEKCSKCDGSPLETGACSQMTCTVYFPGKTVWTSYHQTCIDKLNSIRDICNNIHDSIDYYGVVVPVVEDILEVLADE